MMNSNVQKGLARSWIVLALLCAMPSFAQDDVVESAEAESAEAETAEEATEDDSGDLTQADRIKAVSRKTFLKRGRFEVEPFTGLSTNDAYYQHFFAGGRGSYHIVENLSVEFGGAFATTLPLDTIGFLRTSHRLVPAGSPTLYGHAEVDATFSPVYGKFSFFKEWIINFDGFVSGGAGTIFEQTAGLPVYPSFNVGIGARVFALPWLVVRTDLRYHAYVQQVGTVSTLQNLLLLTVGVGFYFPFGFNFENQAYRVVDAN
ncbi:MAG: outer membrane beta-barrel domain-containing protein [Deltaproteobacteria bacterium]|nr:outer membrane beta-barrel domain-containing protein [Deltaproteobacteria bacterium]